MCVDLTSQYEWLISIPQQILFYTPAEPDADNKTVDDPLLYSESTSSIPWLPPLAPLSLSRMRQFLILLSFTSHFVYMSPTVQRGGRRQLGGIFSGDPCSYGYCAERGNGDSDNEMDDGNDDGVTT